MENTGSSEQRLQKKWKLLCKNEEIKEKDFAIAFSCKPLRMCVVGVRKAVFSAGQLLAAFGSCGDVAKSCRGGRSSGREGSAQKNSWKILRTHARFLNTDATAYEGNFHDVANK